MFLENHTIRQKEPRVKALVMVAFLGYALWITLKHLLKRRPALVQKPSMSGVNTAQPFSPRKSSGPVIRTVQR